MDRWEATSETRRQATEGETRRGEARPRMRAMQSNFGPLYDFPYRAHDFAANEGVFNGKPIHNPDNPDAVWQKYAYDLGAARKLSTGQWVETRDGFDWQNPKNSDYIVHDKPVYAVSGGVIVNCWRNAPENARPFTSAKDKWYDGIPLAEQTWLHADVRAGKSFGAGNFITVLEDDGDLIGYAHARTGTIPAALCPHNSVLLNPMSWKADSAVPTAKQVRVKPGDFLFRTGNAGTSSAPHLHIDRTDIDEFTSLEMRFRHGLASSLADMKQPVDQWTSFAGQQIPPGPVMVKPPYLPGGEFAWHGLTTKAYLENFAHLADSGYQPVWIDGYSVGGKPYFNVIWRPATSAWLGYHNLTGADYQARFDEATQKGFAPVHVESYALNGQARYAAVFVHGAPTDFVARHGIDGKTFDAWFADVSAKGYSPVATSVVSTGGERRYTALFRKQNVGGWVLKPNIAASDYQNEYEANAAAGRRPYAVNAFMHKGKVYYAAAFAEKPAGKRKDRHGMSSGAYQTESETAGKAGLALRAVSGVDGGSSHQYIAVWRQ
jgi:hypothetical protein